MPRYIMSYLCLVVLFSFRTLLVGAERPTFRSDYIFEKDFNAFYKVHKTVASWAAARVRCEAEGAKLVVPTSLDEADSIPVLIAYMLDKFEGAYIGCHDLYSMGHFVTINGSSIKGTILDILWESDQPTLSGRCVAMRRSGRLYKLPCDTPLPYVCKVRAADTVKNDDCDGFGAYGEGWKLASNGICYLVHEEPRDWNTAYGSCYAAGGHLVIIDDKAEADIIRGLFQNVSEKRMPDNEFAFLGFSDMYRRYHYRTVLGQRLDTLSYNDWETNTCKADQKSGASNMSCGGIRRNGLLTTADCNRPAIFFCEEHDQPSRLRRMGVGSRRDHGVLRTNKSSGLSLLNPELSPFHLP